MRDNKWLLPIAVVSLTFILFAIGTAVHQTRNIPQRAQQIVSSEVTRFERALVDGSQTDLRLMQGGSALITAVGIWGLGDKLMFPDQGFAPHIYDLHITRNLARLNTLRSAARPNAWEAFDINGNAFFYCTNGQLSVCLLVSSEQLANALAIPQSQLVSALLRPPLPSWVFWAVLMAALASILGLLKWFNHRRPEPDSPCDNEHLFTMADMAVDRLRMRITRSDHSADISSRDLKLLTCLHQRPDQVVSKDKLYDAGWGRDFIPSSRSLEQHIMTLRKKIDPQRNRAVVIETVHGQGYRYPLKSE